MGEPEPKPSGCEQLTFPPCFCGHMNKFLQEVAKKYLPLLSGLPHCYTHLGRRRLLTGGKFYSVMQLYSSFNVSPSEAEDICKKNQNYADLDW